MRGEYVTPVYLWRSVPRGIDALAMFAGHPLHPFFHAASARAYAALGADYVETIAWVGVVPLLLLALTRFAAGSRHDLRIWRSVAIVFLLWSLGPFLVVGGFDTGLKLPEILARYVPLVANARMPGRAMVGVFMAIGALSGMAAADSTRYGPWLRTPAVQWMVIALVAFEYWDAPIHLTRLDAPAIYSTLAEAGPGAVCEVPFGVGDGLGSGVGSQDRRILFYATLHQHPLVGGYIGRMPADSAARYTHMPVTGTLMQLSDNRPEWATKAVDGVPPCRYLVVHRAASSAALLAYVQQLPADHLAADDERDLYRFR
jgi:hypothetical protein